MLIYNSHAIGNCSNTKSKGLKNMKKTYKRVCKRKARPYSSKRVVGVRRKKTKLSRKKKTVSVSKKNAQFLKGLGLKVKQKR